MGEFLWTFAVQEVLKKVLKLAVEQIGLAWGMKTELLKLRKWLLKVETFLSDIDARKLHHDSVKLWVEDLQHLVHEVDDLLDTLVYEDLRRKVEMGKMKRVRNLISLSNNSLVFRLNMEKKMKNLTDLLYQHCCEASMLGLVGNETPQIDMDLSQLRETISVIDDYKVVGRDVEVSSIVKQVIDVSNQQVTSILPIVGMGGLGKTTLAKLVFNHEMIKKHFDRTIWVCVSEPFFINKILGAILQDLKGPCGGCDIRGVLLSELQKEMQGKRYFLVLDDVWNETSSLWDELKSCLIKITEKSENSIVVTTRSGEVAKIMETLPSYHLSKLSDDQCWSLFEESANAIGLPMNSNFEIIRAEMIKKFGGLPLVARVLGRAVKFQGDYDEWVTSLEMVVRTPLQEENLVLSILKLSVDRLPSSSLKQCFAYCSNFPKDFKFGKEQLIQMWMAQGFIQFQEGRSNITMEETGDMYFKILLSRCLFQDVFKDDRGRIVACKMHDLIHDIACDISNDQKLQHPCNLWLANGSKKVASKLRTIVCQEEMQKTENVIDDKIVDFVCLRVLILNSWKIVELPYSIGKLKHLRYLDISECLIKKLPESIVLLYNLQTLRTLYSQIEYLPKNLRQLVSLRHFEFLVDCLDKSKQMPPHLSQLIQLQTLSGYIAGFEEGCKISELGPLKNLKGGLELLELNQVKSKEEALTAKLVEKENLRELTFNWNGSHNNDLEVLEGLQPHKNLQSLRIKNFEGKSLSNNIFVENLVVIILHNCNNCEMLPMFGELANLEELWVVELDSVRSIGNEFYGNDSNQQKTIFPKLKIFVLNCLRSLEQLEEVTFASNITTFPRLQRLEINDCPNLLNISDVFGSRDEDGFNHLEILTIDGCSKLTELPKGLQFCHSIQRLVIKKCANLNLNWQNYNILSCLRIGPFYKWPKQDFSFLVHLHSLIKLKLYDELGRVTSLPQEFEQLKALQEFSISNFDGIEVLPEWLGNLTSLQNLRLGYCKNLKQLPSREAMLRLTRLRYLSVYCCPQLLLGEGNPERTKLPHSTKIQNW